MNYVVFSGHAHIIEEIFKINDTVIEKVGYIKYLGFIVDKKLNFNEQIDLCKKVIKKN